MMIYYNNIVYNSLSILCFINISYFIINIILIISCKYISFKI